MRKITSLLLSLVLLIVGYEFSALSPKTRAETVLNHPASITITQPAGSVMVGETSEYATLVWNDPWDMSESLDIQHLDSPKCVWPFHNGFDGYSDDCPNGVWCGRANEDNPDLFLLHPGYQGSMHVGRNGHVQPIEANTYTLLTFRMYINTVADDDPGFQIIWTDGTVANIGADDNRYGGTVLYQSYPGWNIYTIDLSDYQGAAAPSPHRGMLPWSGEIRGLRLDPGLSGMNGSIVQLDWVRLSVPNTYPLAWTTDQSGSATVALYSPDGVGANDTLRMYNYTAGQSWSSPLSVPTSQGTLDIPASLPPGDWYVQLHAGGEDSVRAGPWKVQPAPSLRFLSPSYTSGKEYAQVELGNSWDMNDADDIREYDNITPPVFSEGIMSATSQDTNSQNTCSGYWEDPFVKLAVDSDPAIDTTQYRYLTFRLKLDGTPDISYGWMSRIVWSDAGNSNIGVTNDIPLHAGWNEVSLDLWRTDIMDNEDPNVSVWQDSDYRRQLRLDPLERPEATKFYVDNVTLTGNDTIASGSIFKIQYQLDAGENTNTTFYYDTDTNPSGRQLAQEYTPPPLTGPYFIYLPLTLKKPLLSSLSFPQFQWDLTGVTAGSYYICADVSDDYTTTTWCSEVPVIVTAP